MKKNLRLAAGLLLAPLVNLTVAEPAHAPYNVLFIAIDDLNDWVGAFGGSPQTKSATPRMDKFAQSGAIVFQQANCAGPVCCPSRSALLSGFMPNRTGIYGNGQNMLDSQMVQTHYMLPEYFSKHGCPSITFEDVNNASVRDERWYFIRYDDGTEEFYDMQRDPMQWTNLAASKNPEIRAQKSRLAASFPASFAPGVVKAKGNQAETSETPALTIKTKRATDGLK